MVDGLLVIDKPAGPTSHDVVARVRRLVGQRRVGHTGTLDPLATGVLPIVLGRATRLARFVTATEKTYEATVRFGYATATDDSDGPRVGACYSGPMPAIGAIDDALEAFRGQFLQRPPVVSAKKVGGTRSHRLARRDPGLCMDPAAAATIALPAQPVRVSRLVIAGLDGDRLSLTVECSAGFYGRALARDLGERLGIGAHLTSLRRTQTGDLTLREAIALERAEREAHTLAELIVPIARMLTHLPAMTLGDAAVLRTVQGRDVEAGAAAMEGRHVRLLDERGDLVAIAERSALSPGLLHPSVVLR